MHTIEEAMILSRSTLDEPLSDDCHVLWKYQEATSLEVEFINENRVEMLL